MTGGHLHELAKDGDFVRDHDGAWREVDHDSRYRRTAEFMDVVMRSWHERDWDHAGEFFRVTNGGVAERPAQRPHPPIYLGGASDSAMDTAARYADVYLMWGEPVELMAERAARAKQMAADLGRTIEVGTRFQIVCRETDAEARSDAEDIVGSIAESFREKMRSHADRTDSVGQLRQNAFGAPAQTNRASGSATCCGTGSPAPAWVRRSRWSAAATRSARSSTGSSTPASTRSSSRGTATTKRQPAWAGSSWRMDSVRP